jgi:hypothetical protein
MTNFSRAMFLTDEEIDRFVAEKKPSVDPRGELVALAGSKPTMGHRRHSFSVTGEAGNRFDVHLRQGTIDPFDFSVILRLVRSDGSFNLIRNNGLGHSHLNPIEGTRFQNVCHQHRATERYQLRGSAPEHFAEPTDAFSDLASALQVMLRIANFNPPSTPTFDSLMPL